VIRRSIQKLFWYRPDHAYELEAIAKFGLPANTSRMTDNRHAFSDIPELRVGEGQEHQLKYSDDI
jgi:hypothetical protein